MRIRELLIGALVVVTPIVTAAQGTPAPKAEQIAAAVLPLPPDFRASARVHGCGADELPDDQRRTRAARAAVRPQG